MAKFEFDMVICVTSGDGFVAGRVYPQLGWNNGIHVVRENNTGDVEDHCYMTGGVGDGEINNWDNSGSPSFDPYR